MKKLFFLLMVLGISLSLSTILVISVSDAYTRNGTMSVPDNPEDKGGQDFTGGSGDSDMDGDRGTFGGDRDDRGGERGGDRDGDRDGGRRGEGGGSGHGHGGGGGRR